MMEGKRSSSQLIEWNLEQQPVTVCWSEWWILSIMQRKEEKNNEEFSKFNLLRSSFACKHTHFYPRSADCDARVGKSKSEIAALSMHETENKMGTRAPIEHNRSCFVLLVFLLPFIPLCDITIVVCCHINEFLRWMWAHYRLPFWKNAILSIDIFRLPFIFQFFTQPRMRHTISTPFCRKIEKLSLSTEILFSLSLFVFHILICLILFWHTKLALCWKMVYQLHLTWFDSQRLYVCCKVTWAREFE